MLPSNGEKQSMNNVRLSGVVWSKICIHRESLLAAFMNVWGTSDIKIYKLKSKQGSLLVGYIFIHELKTVKTLNVCVVQ